MYILSPRDLERYQLQVMLQKTTVIASACSYPFLPANQALGCVLCTHYPALGYYQTFLFLLLHSPAIFLKATRII